MKSETKKEDKASITLAIPQSIQYDTDGFCDIPELLEHVVQLLQGIDRKLFDLAEVVGQLESATEPDEQQSKTPHEKHRTSTPKPEHTPH